MKATAFDRAVARATGESSREILRRGFSPANFLELDFDPEPDDTPPQVVDWDEADAQRRLAIT